MEITYPQELIVFLKNKHLLIDTNIFRDATVKPSVFYKFFNELKGSDVTLATIDFVKYELLKGAANSNKYHEREILINSIIEVTIPIVPETYKFAYNLITLYGIDGASVNITDIFLGAILMQYKKNICLITRDTSDFMPKIFDLLFIINVPHGKGIFTYGVYQYRK